MSNIAFAWDPRKARSNFLKHGVSFDEAQSVFLISARRTTPQEEQEYWSFQ